MYTSWLVVLVVVAVVVVGFVVVGGGVVREPFGLVVGTYHKYTTAGVVPVVAAIEATKRSSSCRYNLPIFDVCSTCRYKLIRGRQPQKYLY